jgi:U4/U6 small nuclear ribonucleoprotein PRP3
VVIEDGFCVVVVEGVAKAIRRYEKLMTRRIDWSSTGGEDDDVGDEQNDDGSCGKRNACVCVWSGTTASPAFEGAFRFETFRSLVSARARFKDVGLAHFFDAAEGSVAAADEAAEAED